MIKGNEKIASSETESGQELLPPKEKKIKSFDSKWYEFLAIYGLINLLFGSLCLKLGFFPDFFADFTHDPMEGFTGVLMLLIVMPLQTALFIFNIIIGIGFFFCLLFLVFIFVSALFVCYSIYLRERDFYTIFRHNLCCWTIYFNNK